MTLIDTGLGKPEALRQLQTALEAVGVTWQDIDQIILTHMHGDHSGGVEAIQQRVDVPVYVHEVARVTLEGGLSEFGRVQSYFETFYRECGAGERNTRAAVFREPKWQRVHYLRDGDTLLAGGQNFEIIAVPGHSQSDICLWDAESGDAIVGDHLLKDISANAFMEPPIPPQDVRPKALLQYRHSMTRTKTLPFHTIYPGHGSVYVGHTALIEARFAEHEERCNVILEHLHNGKQTVSELSAIMFPWLKGNAVFLGLSEVMGHLDLLVEQSRVTVSQDAADVLMFRPLT